MACESRRREHSIISEIYARVHVVRSHMFIRDDAVGVVDQDGRLYGCVSAWDLKFLNHHRCERCVSIFVWLLVLFRLSDCAFAV
jgi:hypothetical protein